MKAFLLATGLGTRLRPLTDKISKCLLPVGGVPILQRWLDACHSYAIDEVLINIHTQASAVPEILAKHRQIFKVRLVEGTRITREGRYSAEQPGVGRLRGLFLDILCRCAKSSRLVGDAPVSAFSITRSHLGCLSRAGSKPLRNLADHTVTDSVEKPVRASGTLAFAGLLLGSARLLDSISAKRPAYLSFDVLPCLVGNMLAYPISTYLLDIGTPENYKIAQHTWPNHGGMGSNANG